MQVITDALLLGDKEDPVTIWQIEGSVATAVAVAKPELVASTIAVPDIVQDLTKDSQRYLYVGGLHAHGHHGHMLIEGLSRCHALFDASVMSSVDCLVISNLQNISSAPASQRNHRLNPISDVDESSLDHIALRWIITMLKAFPLARSKSLLYIRNTTRFAQLSVPALKFQLFRHYKPEDDEVLKLGAVFEQIRQHYHERCPANKLLYLSRSGSLPRYLQTAKSGHKVMPWERFCINEPELESALAAIGYEIIFMEKLSLVEQIRLMGKARLVVGFEGTNLHNSVFMRTGMIVGLPSPRGASTIGQDNLNLCNPQIPYVQLVGQGAILPGLDDYAESSYRINIPHVINQLQILAKES